MSDPVDDESEIEEVLNEAGSEISGSTTQLARASGKIIKWHNDRIEAVELALLNTQTCLSLVLAVLCRRFDEYSDSLVSVGGVPPISELANVTPGEVVTMLKAVGGPEITEEVATTLLEPYVNASEEPVEEVSKKEKRKFTAPWS